MDLTPGELAALQDLRAKSEGSEVEFVNIGDAQALTELGLAARTGQGWVITAAGREHLQTLRERASASTGQGAADAQAPADNVLDFPGSARTDGDAAPEK